MSPPVVAPPAHQTTGRISIDFAAPEFRNKGKTSSSALGPSGFVPSAYTPSTEHRVSSTSKTSKPAAALLTEDPNANLKLKKAWDVSLSAAKSIPMNAFMLWMAGSSVQIFSIMITAMMFFQPIKSLQNLNGPFERYEASGSEARSFSLLLPKLAYTGIQFAMIGLAIYKCSAMGLLPTTTSDWLAFLEPKTVIEYVAT